MGYDLTPHNADVEDFRFGAFSFPVLLEACGYLFAAIHHGSQWYCPFGVDPRMPEGDQYPKILSNDGFDVTALEAQIMARIARNFVAVQRTLPDDHADQGFAGKKEFKREDIEGVLLKAMAGAAPNEKWPVKIRTDFTDRFERFAEWADRSGGFQIW